MPHRYSIEKLIHYQCDTCRRWWSIADGPTTGAVNCPWCGMHGTLAKKAGPKP